MTGSYFVALSPHCTFKTPEYRPDNGLKIDFVSEFPKHADSFAAFNLLAVNSQQPFPGTIIRIPLRTQEQAKKSQIIDLAITPEDVLKEFKAFQSEVAESLLFLKNIEKVEFRIDDRLLGVAEITNVQESLAARTSIKTAITHGAAQSLAFRLHIRHTYNHEEGDIDLHQQYHVQHKLADINESDASKEFKQWATNESFFAWVALATSLNPSSSIIQSRVFVSLPLPIFMKDNRVNIHGMFALSRDRRSLWTTMDAQSSGKITNEIRWNTYLFKKIVPVVWQEMLVEIAELGRGPIYDYFPIVTSRSLALDETLAKDVFEVALSKDSPIWHTTMNTMVPLSLGLAALEEPPEALLDALKIFSIPVINKIPKRLIPLICEAQFQDTQFTPPTIRLCLRDILKEGSVKEVTIATAVELLKYVLSDKMYFDHHDLPLFPCKDGKLYSLKLKTKVNNFTEFDDYFYISTPEEFTLFGGTGKQFLDLSVCHKDLANQIEEDIVTISKSLNLCQFNLSCFERYAREVGLLKDSKDPSDDPEIEMEGNIDFAWIEAVWKWLDSHRNEELALSLDGMYLIPLQESKKLHQVTLIFLY